MGTHAAVPHVGQTPELPPLRSQHHAPHPSYPLAGQDGAVFKAWRNFPSSEPSFQPGSSSAHSSSGYPNPFPPPSPH